MIEKLDVGHILFLDIETVSQEADYEQLDDQFKALWKLKSGHILRKPADELTEEEIAALYPARAGIFAEFGKIVCISVGVMHQAEQDWVLRLKSFASVSETDLLAQFGSLAQKLWNSKKKNRKTQYFCGHNIKEFDIPYICRRMVANQMPLPEPLQLYGKKPWETEHLLDTMDYWKFGDRKNFTSLKLLAAVLGFPSPKDDIDGSEVGRVFWEEGDIERIATYCEKDVLATVQLFLRLQRKEILREEQVVHVAATG